MKFDFDLAHIILTDAFYSFILFEVDLWLEVDIQGRRNGISNGADEVGPQKFSLLHRENFFGPSMLPQKILKIESLRLAKMYFRH